MNIFDKILSNLPTFPRYKMCVFSGTNSLREIFTALRCIVGGGKIQDPEIFVEKLQRFLRKDNVYLFGAGRMGLYSILKTIDLRPGEEVIVPSFTCAVVPNAVIYAGGKPVYCDISLHDFNIDIAKVENLINSKTRVIYAQHTFGQMCNVEKLKTLSEKYGLVLIEDVALALGAKFQDNYAGTLGDFGFFSTDRSKVINTGLGGFVVVNNFSYAEEFDKNFTFIPPIGRYLEIRILLTFIINVVTLAPRIYWFGKFINACLTQMGLMMYYSDEKSIFIPN